MPYPALPDHRIPYDNDGTVVEQGILSSGPDTVVAAGVLQEWQDPDMADASSSGTQKAPAGAQILATWFFFAEKREVTAFYWLQSRNGVGLIGYDTLYTAPTVQGANDSTNGLDGTWETATLSGGNSMPAQWADDWRSKIKPVSFTGGKTQVRIYGPTLGGGGENQGVHVAHLYGEKVAGQTPNDLIFIDHDTTPGVEFTAAEDFGDRPLGTSVVRQFRVKNASATKTANAINLQCNDSDFVISTDGTTWVVTINIASLAAGAESATMYVRNTTPAPGNLLGPRFSRIVALVGSWV